MWSFFSRDPAKEFSFEILEKNSGYSEDSVWSLHKAKKKVSLFTSTYYFVIQNLVHVILILLICN